jgi:putative membrane protein
MNAKAWTIGIAAAIWLVGSGIASAQTSSSGSTGLTDSERSFVMEASKGSNLEVDLGRLATRQAQRGDVKQFGERMVTDHGKAAKELEQLAKKKAVSVAGEAAAADSEVSKLGKLSGSSFDREYVNAMLKDHEHDVAEFRRMKAEAKDPELKAWVSKTLPTLEDHLSQIKAIHGKLSAQK